MKLHEEDFDVLRRPLESGRQNPKSLAFTLVLCAFLQAMMFALEYYVAADSTIYPNKETILQVHFWITAGLIVLSLIYAIPAVYKRSGKIQYLLSILVSQNLFSFTILISALFFIGRNGEGKDITEQSLLSFTWILLLIGLLIFAATFVRFFILLNKGHYRKGSRNDERRGKFETTSYLPAAILGGVGIVFIIQYLARNSVVDDLNVMVVIVGGIVLFFVMLFVLPEQLVMLYCKFRFKSFNYNERGQLNK